MGKKKSGIKLVLDTNVLISALLFRKETSKIVDLWKREMIIPVLSKETFDEFKKVLGYPKFSLTKDEINSIAYEEVLTFFEVIEVKSRIEGICDDPDDDKFISCALSAGAKFIVSGDAELYKLKRYKSVRIIKPSELLNIFYKKPRK
jgi:putative PIN family toxin of toxin-antitoxin system